MLHLLLSTRSDIQMATQASEYHFSSLVRNDTNTAGVYEFLTRIRNNTNTHHLKQWVSILNSSEKQWIILEQVPSDLQLYAYS